MILRCRVGAIFSSLLIIGSVFQIAVTADVRPKIYIYDDLPAKWRNAEEYGHEMDYPGEKWIMGHH